MPRQKGFDQRLPWPRTVQHKRYECDGDIEANRDSGSDPHTNPDPSQEPEQQIILNEKTAFDETQGWRDHDQSDVTLLLCHQQGSSRTIVPPINT